jgi:hypothetical protein
MVKVYIEPRPKGRPAGTPIDDYAVEDGANSVLSTYRTQADAIVWAKARGHSPIMVAHVRYTSKGSPDHWRPHS